MNIINVFKLMDNCMIIGCFLEGASHMPFLYTNDTPTTPFGYHCIRYLSILRRLVHIFNNNWRNLKQYGDTTINDVGVVDYGCEWGGYFGPTKTPPIKIQ
jgi:hypothetical protein